MAGFTSRGPAAAATASELEDNDDGRRRRHFPEPPTPTLGAGDAMLVIRDALLSQLQQDRLRQEIVVAEIAKIERAMALRSASSVDAERAEAAVPVASNDHAVLPHGSRAPAGPEPYVAGVDEPHDPKEEDGVRWSVVETEPELEKPDMEDGVDERSGTTCTAGKTTDQEDEALGDASKLQEANETTLPKNTSSAKRCCAICRVQAPSDGHLQQHFAGQKHRSKVATLVSSRNNAYGGGLKAKSAAERSVAVKQLAAAKPRQSTWVCRFCQSNCTCKSDLENHLKGKKHQAKIQSLLEECRSFARNCVSPSPSPEGKVPSDIVAQGEENTWSCSLCRARCTRQSELENHLGGKRHKLNFLVLQVEAKQHLSEWGCGICQAKCNSESQFDDHCTSRGHQQKVEALLMGWKHGSSSSCCFKTASSDQEEKAQRTFYYCKLCSVQCNSVSTLAAHRRGKKHAAKAEQRSSSSFCEVCDLQCNSEKVLAQHRAGKKHLAKLIGC